MKKILTIVLALLLCMAAGLAMAAETITVDGITYEVQDNKATITEAENASGDVVIPKQIGEYTVTAIGAYAFEGCASLTSVTIPDSVKSIGAYAFFETGLTSVTIPGSVESIGEAAFHSCLSLTSVTLSEGLTTVAPEMFGHCYALKDVILPSTLKTISDRAFVVCPELKSITIPSGVTSIGNYAFLLTGLTSVTIPNSVKIIGEEAFAITGLTSVTIPDSVTSIGDRAFSGTALTKAYIPKDKNLESRLPEGVEIHYSSGGCSWKDKKASDETHHWEECSCGVIRNRAEHIPGAPATETTPQTCTVCGWELAPVVIPAATPVPDTGSLPKTGDESNVVFWAALLMMAGAGALTMRRARKN